MAYPLRPNVPGATYHVNSKGTNGEAIVYDDEDRRRFLWHLDRTTRRYGWILFAYCLMTNHYHLLLRVPTGGLSAGMRLLNRGYSWGTNRRHERSMHLFRQRFFSEEIESEAHLLATCRYVVLNPVRAGICEQTADWPWSSYRSTAGLEPAPAFVAREAMLRLFDPDPMRAERRYRAFVEKGLGPVSDTGVRGAAASL